METSSRSTTNIRKNVSWTPTYVFPNRQQAEQNIKYKHRKPKL